MKLSGSAKIIYLTNGETLIDNRSGKILQSLRIPQAIKLLESFGVKYCINGGINANESFQESNANSDGIADGPGIKRAITQDNKKGDGYVIDQTELHTHSSLDDLFNIISRFHAVFSQRYETRNETITVFTLGLCMRYKEA